MADVSWQPAYSSSDRVHLSLIKSALDKEGIINVEFNQQDSSYLVFGKVHLMVPEEHLESAKALIEQLDLLGE
ncbi:MAG: DUF2007 domain-containing protein [Saprospiraceae bacterium]|nr:DUF2007 domain-containing protein [Saprospiraceae bacterium]